MPWFSTNRRSPGGAHDILAATSSVGAIGSLTLHIASSRFQLPGGCWVVARDDVNLPLPDDQKPRRGRVVLHVCIGYLGIFFCGMIVSCLFYNFLCFVSY